MNVDFMTIVCTTASISQLLLMAVFFMYENKLGFFKKIRLLG